LQLDREARQLLDLLEQAGYRAYAVGGCVRDACMGRAYADIDLCTSALPRQTEAVLAAAGIRYIETGLQHGTVTAVLNGKTYEITTFRTDGSYTDSRHPDGVTFVPEVETDLARRDFTVNAMAYHPVRGFVDPFGGQAESQVPAVRGRAAPAVYRGRSAYSPRPALCSRFGLYLGGRNGKGCF